MNMHKVFSKSLDERYFFKYLNCGLPVFFIPKKGINEKVALIAVKYGSNDNSWHRPGDKESTTMPEGIAHFLEHQQFKKESGDISMDFAIQGAMYNASTGYQTTTYFFQGADNFDQNLDILAKLVFTSYFNPESVEKEKHIIEQELRMYNDMANFKIYDNLMQNLYQKHPIRISIGGTVESVRQITLEMLQNCYRTFYNPANMVAVVCGDMEPARVFEQVDKSVSKYFGQNKPGGNGIIRNIPEEPKEISNFSTTAKMEVSTPYLMIGFKDNRTGFEGVPLIKQNVVSDTLLRLIFGKSSRLYSRLYEEKLIDDRFGCSYSSYKTFGFTILSAETEKAEALYQRLMSEIRKLGAKKSFKKRDLEFQKRKLMGKFVWTFNSPMAIVFLYSGYFLNKVITPPKGKEVFSAPKLVSKIALKDINKRFEELLDEKYHAFSLIQPLSSGQ